MKKVLNFCVLSLLAMSFALTSNAKVMSVAGAGNAGSEPPPEPFFEEGYHTATCSVECGGQSHSCSVTSDDAQSGSVNGAGDKACYCGVHGEEDVEVAFCNEDENGNYINGGTSDLELKDDLKKSTPSSPTELSYPSDFDL